MKKQSEKIIAITVLVVAFLTCTVIVGFSQNADQLQGLWLNEQQTRKAEFTKQGSEYFAKVVWVSDSNDKIKAGDVIFKNLKWSEDRFTGYAQTPQGEASCTITFVSESKIKIVVSKGFMSRTILWSRTDK